MADPNDNIEAHQQERILVIDDSPIIREMLVEILTDAGYRVDTAEDGEVGAAMALRGDYIIILCDVHMPRMNGLETVQEIIQSKPLSRIIMTDSFPDKLAKSAREAGAMCCLQKPFDVTELREMIARVKKEGKTTIGR
jgi:two-component system response regulator (stage 0 sporulation protein F)